MRAPRPSGFTLIELVVSMTVLMIVAAMAVTPLMQGVVIWSTGSARTRLLDEGRLTLEAWSREVRQVRSAGDVAEFTDTVFDFTRTDGTAVRWELNGASLDRNGASACGYLAAMDFDYLDGVGVAAAAAADIRLVEIELTLTDAGQTVKLRTSAAPRNLLAGTSTWEEQ